MIALLYDDYHRKLHTQKHEKANIKAVSFLKDYLKFQIGNSQSSGPWRLESVDPQTSHKTKMFYLLANVFPNSSKSKWSWRRKENHGIWINSIRHLKHRTAIYRKFKFRNFPFVFSSKLFMIQAISLLSKDKHSTLMPANILCSKITNEHFLTSGSLPPTKKKTN